MTCIQKENVIRVSLETAFVQLVESAPKIRLNRAGWNLHIILHIRNSGPNHDYVISLIISFYSGFLMETRRDFWKLFFTTVSFDCLIR